MPEQTMAEVFRGNDWKLDGTMARLDEWNTVGIADDEPDDLFIEVETERGSVPLSVVAELLRRAGWTVSAPPSQEAKK